MLQSFSLFIKGILIGAGAILPGISSGVICMIFGLYEKLINCILGFFKDIKENFKFLFPIAMGGLIGIILFSTLVFYCLTTIPCQTKSLFIGLLLGSLSVLAQENLKDTTIPKQNLANYLSFFICFLIGLAFIYIENIFHFSTEYTPNEFSDSFLILSGFLMSIGIVVPGISSTVILMLLGIYSTYLTALSMVNMTVLSPIMIGCFIGCILFMKLIKILLDHFHSQTIFAIIGFSLGSVFVLYPTYSFNLESLMGITLLVLGYFIGKSIKKE